MEFSSSLSALITWKKENPSCSADTELCSECGVEINLHNISAEHISLIALILTYGLLFKVHNEM